MKQKTSTKKNRLIHKTKTPSSKSKVVALEVSLQIGMNVKMTPILQEDQKQTTKKIVTYYRHCKA
jgi:hypothetical protein